MGKGKNIYNTVCLKLVGVGILLWLVSQTDMEHLGDILAAADLIFVLLAISLLTLHLLVKFSRFHYFLAGMNITLAFKKTVHYSLAANYLSFITPGRVGELFKAYFIHQNIGTSLTKLLASSIIDRLFDAYILILSVVLGLIFSNLLSKPYSIIFAFIFVLLIVSPFVFLNRRVKTIMPAIVQRLMIKRFKFTKFFADLKNEFIEVPDYLGVKMVVGVLISVGAYTLFFGSCYMMAEAVGISLSFFQISFFVACATILSFLPISFAGIGTREASLIFLFSTEGVSQESALAFSALIFILTYLFFGIVGFICFMTLDCNPNISNET